MMAAAWGVWKEFHVNAPVNHAPVAAASNFTATHNQNIAASSLFSASDPDGEAITKYQFWDSTANALSGHFVVGGVAQGTGQAIDVTAAQLSSTTFQSGSGSDDLWVRAFDGMAWGAWTEFYVNAPDQPVRQWRRPPTTPRHITKTSRSRACISVNDADGDPVTKYQF